MDKTKGTGPNFRKRKVPESQGDNKPKKYQIISGEFSGHESKLPKILQRKLLVPSDPGNFREYSWVVNVTSMEGVFNWKNKGTNHPHTNMAKAALNMFTRTSGKYYAKSNIIMCCVDTGWNNSQNPKSYDVITPLDCVDGAARILDPIYRGLITHSVLYKDWDLHDW